MVKQTINQSTNRPTNKPINQTSTSQATDQSMNRPHPINQRVSHPGNQAIHQSDKSVCDLPNSVGLENIQILSWNRQTWQPKANLTQQKIAKNGQNRRSWPFSPPNFGGLDCGLGLWWRSLVFMYYLYSYIDVICLPTLSSLTQLRNSKHTP